MKKNIVLFLFFTLTVFVYSEEPLLGAKDFLGNLSEKYKGSVKDLTGKIKWVVDNVEQKGTIIFKNPQRMRIDFNETGRQVICTNGYEFWVYIDTLNMVLHQDLMGKEKKKDENGKVEIVESQLMLNPVGYDRFLRDYSVEYGEVKGLVDYKDGSKVYTFKLRRWRTSQGGFNQIIITVQDNGIMRKVEGLTAAFKKVVIEIDDVVINQGLADSKFNYVPPAQANTVENFINKGEN